MSLCRSLGRPQWAHPDDLVVLPFEPSPLRPQARPCPCPVGQRWLPRVPLVRHPAQQLKQLKVICPFCAETPRGYPSVIARGCLPAQVGSSAIGGFQ